MFILLVLFSLLELTSCIPKENAFVIVNVALKEAAAPSLVSFGSYFLAPPFPLPLGPFGDLFDWLVVGAPVSSLCCFMPFPLHLLQSGNHYYARFWCRCRFMLFLGVVCRLLTIAETLRTTMFRTRRIRIPVNYLYFNSVFE